MDTQGWWDAYVVLVWEKENTLQQTLETFFDGLKIGSEGPAADDKKADHEDIPAAKWLPMFT